ncbi:MAG: hypothetical protein ACRDYA_05045 [Egibacteraceae bacterium]
MHHHLDCLTLDRLALERILVIPGEDPAAEDSASSFPRLFMTFG